MPPPSSYILNNLNNNNNNEGSIYRSASLNHLGQNKQQINQTVRSQSVSRIVEYSPFGVAGSTYIPFHSYSSVKPNYYRVNPNFSLRNHIYDKYYYFSPRYRRTQFHRHYYHGFFNFLNKYLFIFRQIDQYPYRWNFQSKATITGQYYWVRRLQFDPIEYGAYRYYDPYRRYYDPYYDSYIKLYDYRSKLFDSLY